ncbi:hypothetical protein GP486_004802 [Trichoglossum hirsutum]|uniref:Uncharacterized protein n=1 Tax=Trichoglossum hirsutum TaxID=265104 RepID=A0A9P8LAG3_9PEZI|nr:hypothetical protein GP486_004802 [Trichoglossum hirsutum]
MYFPKLSPLQSRFAGSLVATLLLLLIYLSITNPQFAYAAAGPEDVYQHRPDTLGSHVGEDVIGEGVGVGVGGRRGPGFEGLERGIIGRAESGVNALKNNAPEQLNITPGDTQYWIVENSTLWGSRAPQPSQTGRRHRRRDDGFDPQDTLQEDEDGWELDESFDGVEDLRARQVDSGRTRTLYITLNTCIQPSSNSSNSGLPPQLQLYVSTLSDNQKPGLNVTNKNQKVVPADGGFAKWTLNATGDTYIGVFAPPSTSSFQGIYNYEIAASIDEPYHSYNDTGPNLFLVDSDSNSALLISSNLSQSLPDDGDLAKIKPPFVMFAHNQNDSMIQGLQNSYCGLKKYAQIAALRGEGNSSATNAVTMGITTRGQKNEPKEQFYVTGLNRSSSYFGYLAMMGNSTAADGGVVGGGGRVWKPMNFSTKSDGNCQIIYNLTFCDEVAYAVPSNPQNSSELASWYDTNALSYYQNFSYSLQQVACNTTSSAQYSLARTCQDCEKAYKEWLCSVTIPRCEDYSSTKSFLVKRNVADQFINGSLLPDNDRQKLLNLMYHNSSRNPSIDTELHPGPYNEVLPCEDLCFALVQSCPAVLQFGCPSGIGSNWSYGVRSESGDITCNYPGAAFQLPTGRTSAGNAMGPTNAILFIVAGLWLWL